MRHQIPLPASRALPLVTWTEPEERLDALIKDRREAFGDIRAVLDKFSAKYRFRPRDLASAMDHADDMLGDLFYGAKEEIEDEISERERRRDEAEIV